MAADVTRRKSTLREGNIEDRQRDGEAIKERRAERIAVEAIDEKATGDALSIHGEFIDIEGLAAGEFQTSVDALAGVAEGEDAGAKGGIGDLLHDAEAERFEQRSR